MYNLRRILVCLDLSNIDDQLIKAASAIANHLEGQSFYFLHVVESLELPPNLIEKYPDLIAPVDENVKHIIEERLNEYFTKPDKSSYEIDVIEGNTTDIILRWSRIKEVDLIVMGKKPGEAGSGILTEKIVKLCHCSFLLVPDNSHHELKKILVPLDLSENSKMVLEQAILISEKSGASIACLHCFKVPSGYHTTGKSYADFVEIMRSNSIHDYKIFLRNMGLKDNQYPCIHLLSESKNTAETIHNTALNENTDLIIMGSKGRTGLASILLGSVAMKTVKYDLKIELLVVKDKKENMGFLEALINL